MTWQVNPSALLSLDCVSEALVSTPRARMVRALHRPSKHAASLRSLTSGDEGGSVLLEALVSFPATMDHEQ